MDTQTSRTDVKETLSLQQQVQDWADLHYQNYYFDLTKGPELEPQPFVRKTKVVPLTEAQLKLEETRCPNNWKTAWPKKWGFALPRGMKPPAFLTWQDAISFWKHHVKEYDRMKRHQNAVKGLRKTVEMTENLQLWRKRPELYRFQPTRFQLPDSEIGDVWVERINKYFFQRMMKRELLDREDVVELRCYQWIEEEHCFLKVCLVRYRNN